MESPEETACRTVEMIRKANDPDVIPKVVSNFVWDGKFDVGVKVTKKILIEKIESNDDAIQFVLEEIDAATHGNKEAFEFSKSVAINPLYFVDSMGRSKASVDGPNGPQQFLLRCCIAMNDIELSCKFRIAVVKAIIHHYQIANINEP